MKPAFSNTLLEQVLNADNLQAAYKRVRANKGAPGIDGMTVEEFPVWVRSGAWKSVAAALAAGRYQPSAVRRVEIEKPDGGTRPLGIPTVLDRVIQQAIAQVLGPLFEPGFSPNSFGFRPGRNAQQAVLQVQTIIQAGRKIVVDVDIAKFFDRVNHDLLMTRLGARVKDKRLMQLIKRYLRAGFKDDEGYHASVEGVPQGGPLSPLLANIMLDPLDKELEKRGHAFARYADDFAILVKSQRAGERVLSSISRFLERKLKLQVNAQKTRVVKSGECKFLGFTFPRGRISWHPQALEKFKQRVRELTNRNWGVSRQYQIDKLSEYLRGWINYFGIASGYQRCVELDHWIRRRMRMAYWRQWRKVRTKIRNLIAMGVETRTAILCGLSSKGPWRNAKTPAIQQALSLEFFNKVGLHSLREGWIKLHYPE
jgi:RNA-directed DNA polymerase